MEHLQRSLAVRDEMAVGCIYAPWNACFGNAVSIVASTVGGYNIYTHVAWAVWYNWDAVTGVWYNCASPTHILSDSCKSSTILALQGLIDYGNFRETVIQRANEIMSVVKASTWKALEVKRLLDAVSMEEVAKEWLQDKYDRRDFSLGWNDEARMKQILTNNVMELVESLKDLVGWNDIKLENTAVGVGYGVGIDAGVGVGIGMDLWTNHPAFGNTWAAYFWDYTAWKWACCKKKFSLAVTPEANFGASVKGAADLSFGLSLVTPEGVGGYGASVAFGVAYGGGFQVSVNFAFDTTQDRVYVAGVSIAAAGGAQWTLGQIAYGYTEVVLSHDTYPEGSNPGTETAVGGPGLPPGCSEDNECAGGCRIGCSHPGSHYDTCILRCAEESLESAIASRNKQLKQANKLLRGELTKFTKN